MTSDTDMGGSQQRFPTTVPTLIAESGSQRFEIRARAFEELVRVYWKPVYKYLRVRHKKSNEDAKDYTQEFFAMAFEKNIFQRYDPEKAKFRTFVRICLDRFVINQHEYDIRQKRGGEYSFLQFDFSQAEIQLPLVGSDPETLFEKEWVRSFFEYVLTLLREEYESKGKQRDFEIFESYYLTGNKTYSDVALAFALKVSEVTNKLAAARRDVRRLMLAQLHQTTGNPAEFRREARRLLGMQVSK